MAEFLSTQSKGSRYPDEKRDAVQSAITNDQKRPEDQDDEDFLTTARKRFARVLSSEAMNRKDAVDDLMFKNGEQWPANIKTQRVLEKRPCLTVNKMKTFVHQVTNNMRQNRPSINISPIGDGADKTTANMLKGLIRQIERESNATIAYDTGYDSAVSNGWGYWRLRTEFEDDRSFNQCIRVDRIRNPMRVYLDPDSQMPDGSDAKWAFISDLIPREEFEEMYPDAEMVPWEQGATGDDAWKDWSTQTHVRVAEYYCFVTQKKRLLSLADGFEGFEDELPDEAKKLLEVSPELIVDEREVDAKTVYWSKITAHQILDEQDLPGKWIPIVKCSGDEVDVEGKVTMAGIIRDAKDPQRMKNYWATHKTELVALAPKAPFILEEGQIEGHEQRWQQANAKSYPYLLYKGTSIAGKQAPAPQRQQLVGAPAGIIEAEQSAEQDMMGTTGVRFDATKSERLPDESGKALSQLRMLGELGSYHYTVNYIHALTFTARIYIDWIPKVYTKRQVVTILRDDDTEEQVTLDPSLGVPFQTRPNQQNGKVEKLYNPGLGKYDVAVTMGPNFATKRQEAADNMISYMRNLGPEVARIVAGPIARNQDWPGADEIADRMDSMLPPQVLQKGLDQMGDLPPKAKALIGSLSGQLQQAQQQMQMMGKELEDKRGEMALDKYKVDKDTDAKWGKIAADLKMHMESLINERLGAKEKMQQDGFEAARDQTNREADRELAERKPAPGGTGA